MKRKTLWALDCETTGLGLFHGCKPFHVSLLNDKGQYVSYTWPVNPKTREVILDNRDMVELVELLLDESNTFVMHNAKFDVRCLEVAQIISYQAAVRLLAERVHDTQIASHLVHSIGPHGLKELGIKYLGIPATDQSNLQEATIKARHVAKKLGWAIADPSHPHLANCTGNVQLWPMDCWLMQELERDKQQARSLFGDETPPSETLRQYAYLDVERTLKLWSVFQRCIRQNDHWHLYLERLALLPITYRMEAQGVNILPQKLERETLRHRDLAETAKKEALVAIPLRLKQTIKKETGNPPNLNSGKQLGQILYTFQGFGLPVPRKTQGGADATDAATLQEIYAQLSNESLAATLRQEPTLALAQRFTGALLRYRKHSKSFDYLNAYAKHAIGYGKTLPYDRLTIHSSINICGTRETRQSTSSPNFQNVSKGVETANGEREHNLRCVFGPEKGTVWLSSDYDNIEMRIWAYSVGNKELIQCFEKGQSVHLLIMQQVWGFADKERDEYRWTKNGDFAIIYGASPSKVDATYKKAGAYELINKRFPEVGKFSAAKIDEVKRNQRKHGIPFVETLGGYPLVVPPTEPHKACNYFVQGTAGLIMMRAMHTCDTVLRPYRLEFGERSAFITMQVHDELDFQVRTQWAKKLGKELTAAMETAGNSVGIPTPVNTSVIEYPNGWDTGTPLHKYKAKANA